MGGKIGELKTTPLKRICFQIHVKKGEEGRGKKDEMGKKGAKIKSFSSIIVVRERGGGKRGVTGVQDGRGTFGGPLLSAAPKRTLGKKAEEIGANCPGKRERGAHGTLRTGIKKIKSREPPSQEQA